MGAIIALGGGVVVSDIPQNSITTGCPAKVIRSLEAIMKNNHRISIIYSAVNHENYINIFIASVLNQSIQNFELIIIDDYS